MPVHYVLTDGRNCANTDQLPIGIVDGQNEKLKDCDSFLERHVADFCTNSHNQILQVDFSIDEVLVLGFD